jgi:hypothetical protein
LSFYVEFTAASHDDALRIVLAEEFLPDSVRTFVCQALEAYRAARAIYVKAVGHLYSKDFEVSSAEIVVREIKLRYPKSGPSLPGHEGHAPEAKRAHAQCIEPPDQPSDDQHGAHRANAARPITTPALTIG